MLRNLWAVASDAFISMPSPVLLKEIAYNKYQRTRMKKEGTIIVRAPITWPNGQVMGAENRTFYGVTKYK